MKVKGDKMSVYPVLLSPDDPGYVVKVPDLGIVTEGDNLAESIGMARDAIGLMVITMEDDGEEIPQPFSKHYERCDGDIETLVDVDFVEYRRKHDQRMVKKNCTIPYYLKVEAEKRGINFSKVLQDALIEKVGM